MKLWRDTIIPEIANTLLEIQNQKTDDETDWMADRALHNEHIHSEYEDKYWPSESIAKAAYKAARTSITALNLLTTPNQKPKSKKARSVSADFLSDLR